jgi:hypothetical protein
VQLHEGNLVPILIRSISLHRNWSACYTVVQSYGDKGSNYAALC